MNHMLPRILGLIICLLVFSGSIAQNAIVSGTVQSYSGKKVRLLKRTQRNVKFNGPVSGATVSVIKDRQKILQTKTDHFGEFEVELNSPGKYRLVMSKQGHSIVSFSIKVPGSSTKKNFSAFGVLLKENGDEDVFFGAYTINEDGTLSFLPAEENVDKSSNDVIVNNVGPAWKTIEINNNAPSEIKNHTIVQKEKGYRKRESFEKSAVSDSIFELDSSYIISHMRLNELDSVLLEVNGSGFDFFDELKSGKTESTQAYINDIKELMSGLDTNSAEYNMLESRVILLEDRLNQAKELNQVRQKELEANEKKAFYMRLTMIGLLVILVLLAFFLYKIRHFSNKLKEQNIQINESRDKIVSSIEYASVMQSGFLQPVGGLKEMYDNSFIYYRPKDIVSGDFYWFGEENGYEIIVVADCTGHGVPGAMLTVLGHSTISHLVHAEGIVEPDELLLKLNERLRDTFDSNESFLEHGMDCVIVAREKGASQITVAGAVNGLYVEENGKLTHHDSMPLSLGYDFEKKHIISHKLNLTKGNRLYLYSDGYFDQFQGNTDLVVKFNLERFEGLLLDLSKTSFGEARQKLETTFENWKQSAEQVDDVLILGFEI